MASQRDLTDALHAAGVLPAEWENTVAAVDRAGFIPDRFPGHDAAADLEAWQAAVYSDTPIVTQVNDGEQVDSTDYTVSSSSSSQPSIMLEMLELLDVHNGHKVLEVGTGTGYNAAWLSRRLGDSNVTSVEIDQTVLDGAAASLKQAGYSPTLVCGDGREGHYAGRPYDRIICTYTVRDIPSPWLMQCPDGKIVAPWGSSYFSGSFVTLDVVDGVGTGTFSGYPAFMWDRSQRPARGHVGDLYGGRTGDTSTTRFSPLGVVQDAPAFFISLVVPDAWYHWGAADDDSGEATLWLFSDQTGDDRSCAIVEYVPGAEAFEVEQFGPRRLWDEVQGAYLRWEGLGFPSRDDFGLTVSIASQHVWLGSPNRRISL